MEEDVWLSCRDAAALIGVSSSTIDKASRDPRNGFVVRIGPNGRRQYRRSDVLAYDDRVCRWHACRGPRM